MHDCLKKELTNFIFMLSSYNIFWLIILFFWLVYLYFHWLDMFVLKKYNLYSLVYETYNKSFNESSYLKALISTYISKTFIKSTAKMAPSQGWYTR